jgi:hypothetical protein
MSFVNQLISYIIKFVLTYNTFWFNYNIICLTHSIIDRHNIYKTE